MRRVNFGNLCGPIPRAMSLCALSAALAAGCSVEAPARPSCTTPPPLKVVLVIEENHGYSQIIGNPDAPYINRLAGEGASFSRSFDVTHPSQPNYLALFSGSTQGITDDQVHPHDLFNTPNLGSKLLAAGLTFGGYSEGLPQAGSDVEDAGDDATGLYRRKHNPWVNWQDDTVPLPPAKLPPSVNLPFTAFPADPDQLPTVAIVVPSQRHNMHDGSVAEADSWLQQNIEPFVRWARTHNGLLILTWDEGGMPEFDRIPTILHGPMVRTGIYDGVVNHYSMLRTLEDLFGLPHDGQTPSAGPVQCDVWASAG